MMRFELHEFHSNEVKQEFSNESEYMYVFVMKGKNFEQHSGMF
jgi:hypothetical protein